jgi:hypothetical protein
MTAQGSHWSNYQFTVPDEHGAGIDISYTPGETQQVYDARNLYAMLYTNVTHLELGLNRDIVKCIKLVEKGKTPGFLDFNAAENAESIIRSRKNETEVEDSSFLKRFLGIFVKAHPPPRDEILDLRHTALQALSQIYQKGEQSIYAQYCEAVDSAQLVCNKLDVSADIFPSYAQFLKLSEEERKDTVSHYKEAADVVKNTFDDYMEHSMKVSVCLTGGDDLEEMHYTEYLQAFTEPNAKEALEVATEFAKARWNVIEAYIDKKALFGEKPEIVPDVLLNSPLADLKAEAAHVKQQTVKLKQLNLAMIRSDINADPQSRRNAFKAFENASIDMLDQTLEHFTPGQKPGLLR